MATNVDEIAADPELLRQWLYHAAAELVFRHVALGDSGRRILLDPQDRDEALARANGLASLAEALAVLVPAEGAALAKLLSERFNGAAATIRTRYADVEAAASPADAPEHAESIEHIDSEDEQVRVVREQHLLTLADLCLIRLQWRPSYHQLWIAEEVLRFAQGEMAFLDEAVLRRVERRVGYEMPHALLVLLDLVRSTGDYEKTRRLTAEQRKSVVDGFMAELLREMAISAYDGYRASPKQSLRTR